MLYKEKIESVERLAGRFRESPLAILADYRGLTVEQITELRRKVSAAEGEFLVAKNTLVKLAIKDTSYETLEPFLKGPSAIAFAFSDPVAVAKAVDSFAKDNDALELKGGVMEGEALDPGKIKQLASMPGRDELRAQLLALLMTPATQMVRVLSAPAQQMVQVLHARQTEQDS